MTRREVIRTVLEGGTPPYVPWHFSFTKEAKEKLDAHGTRSLEDILRGHLLWLSSRVNVHTDIGNDKVRDGFGVVWDQSRDKDIGTVHGCVLPEPTLKGYSFPEISPKFFEHIPGEIEQQPDMFRQFSIGFSLYERAWTLRGMENLMMDFLDHPDFVHELLSAIADHNIAQLREALKFDIDAVYFGDDWGQQHGLQMGPKLWKEFIYPQLKRMYAAVRDAGKFIMIHSCGDVDELFDDLIEIGLNCFNPFQPEVMDVEALLKQYRGRLSFFGGLSTQKTLPYGTEEDVRAESRRLLALGRAGSYIFAPAHAVEGDVPLENLLAFIETVAEQTGL
ncbi:MAG: uroporphyrinogen-III decarboxylase-like protein [Phycisphaerae bacterium]|nr:uroporphyrinogen-III decarboxylase-like protein [Phycisphaerae bacterium]